MPPRDVTTWSSPASDKPGACVGPGAIGERTVEYEVCYGGEPAHTSRVEPCQR